LYSLEISTIKGRLARLEQGVGFMALKHIVNRHGGQIYCHMAQTAQKAQTAQTAQTAQIGGAAFIIHLPISAISIKWFNS